MMTKEMQILVTNSINQLEREEELLEQLQSVMTQVREDLLSKNAGLIDDLSSRQSELTVRQRAIVRSRAELKQEIARTLLISEDAATIGRLCARYTGNSAAELQERCERVKAKSLELNALLIANGNLAFQLWELLERVFRTLSGAEPVPQVYQRNGQRRAA